MLMTYGYEYLKHIMFATGLKTPNEVYNLLKVKKSFDGRTEVIGDIIKKLCGMTLEELQEVEKKLK